MPILLLAFLGTGSGLFGGKKRYTAEEKALLASLLRESMERPEEPTPYIQPQANRNPRGRY